MVFGRPKSHKDYTNNDDTFIITYYYYYKKWLECFVCFLWYIGGHTPMFTLHSSLPMVKALLMKAKLDPTLVGQIISTIAIVWMY